MPATPDTVPRTERDTAATNSGRTPVTDHTTTEAPTTEIPAHNLHGFITRAIGLDPDQLSDAQHAEITRFITDYTL